MDTERKPWGESELLLHDGVRICRVRIDRGGYSSQHLHERCWNLFVVHDGVLEVRLDGEPSGTWVGPGSSLLVPPGRMHQFYARTGVVATEVYWVDAGELPESDIRRLSSNGLDCAAGDRPQGDGLRGCGRGDAEAPAADGPDVAAGLP